MGKKQTCYRDRAGRIIQKGSLVRVSTVIGLNGEFRVRRAGDNELAIGEKRLRDVYSATLQVIESRATKRRPLKTAKARKTIHPRKEKDRNGSTG
jgi:hypothetical protein